MRSRPSSSAIAAAIGSRWSPRRGRAAITVTSTEVGRQPRRGHAVAHGAQELAAGDPAWRPCVGREEAPEVAQRGRPEQRVGDGVEDDVAIGVAVEARGSGDLDAAEHQRTARPKRMAVVADPGARRRARRGSRPTRARSPGTVTLRFAGSPGTTCTGTPVASSSDGFVGPRLGPVRREPFVRGAQQVAAHTLRCLGGTESGPVDGLADDVAVDPLEGLGDRHDRDRGAVECGLRGDRDRRAPVVTRGRAPSWTRTTPRSAAPRRSKASEPGMDRLLAAGPPTTTSTTLGGQPRARPRARRRVRRAVTTTIRATSGPPRPRPASRPAAAGRRARP